MAIAKKRALTVRLPEDLYRAGAEVAKRRKVSVNRLVQQCFEETVKAEEKQRLFDEFTLLGQDAEECDVEFAFEAQREVVMRDEE